MLLAIGHHGSISGVIVCLIVVGIATAAVWFVVSKALGRPDIGNPAAAIVFILGALLCIL